MKKFFNKSELSLVNSESTNNKQANDNKVNSQLSWIIASLGQVAHFTSVVIRNVLATSGWVRSAHTAPYAKSAHNSLVKAIAFTLAETLVVMGIIGVVAALTIPNLNQSTGNKEKVVKLKKIYSNLEDAYGRATAVYGPLDEWFGDIYSLGYDTVIMKFAGRIEEFLKVSKKCEVDKQETCFAFKRAEVNISPSPNSSSYILADGTALRMSFSDFERDGKRHWRISIIVDIDGNKGANSYGKDTFAFAINDDDLVLTPYGASNTPGGQHITESCFSTTKPGSRINCTGWVIETGNMDYLKLDKDGKCPNGTELSWENTSCK